MALKATVQMTVRDMVTGANLEKVAVRVYYEFPDLPAKTYLSPIPPGTITAPPEPKRLTDATGKVNIKYSMESASRYFYVLVTKPGYAPVIVAATMVWGDKTVGEIYTEPGPLGRKVYQEKRTTTSTCEVHPKEVFMCKLPDPPPGFVAVVAADAPDPRTLPGSPAGLMDFPLMNDAFAQFVAGPDVWDGVEPSYWGNAGVDWPPTGADAGPCGVITGWTASVIPPPPTIGMWWQYISMPPPNPMSYMNDADLVTAYMTWRGLGNPLTPPMTPMPPPPLGWWQTTMTPPPEMTMFPDTAAKAAAYRNWYGTH